MMDSVRTLVKIFGAIVDDRGWLYAIVNAPIIVAGIIFVRAWKMETDELEELADG